MPIVDPTKFTPDLAQGGFVGSVRIDARNAVVFVRSPHGNIEAAWDNAERVLSCLCDEMPSVEQAVRELFSRLGRPNEDTPGGRRRIERLLGRLAESDVTCTIYDDKASVYFDAPRLTDHCIEVQFGQGGTLALATLAG